MSNKIKERYLSLDLMRGIAAIGIVFHHIFAPTSLKIASGFYIFVDFFFVLSGFVLSEALPKKPNSLEITTFIKKRVFRLFPTLIIGLITSVVVYYITRHWEKSHHLTLIHNSNYKLISFIAASFLLQIFISNTMFFDIPLWSLSAEFFVNIISIPINLLKEYHAIWFFIFSGYLMLWYGLNTDKVWISHMGPIRGYEAVGRCILGFGLGVMLKNKYSILSKYCNKAHFTISLILLIISLFSFQFVGYNNLYFNSLIFGYFILQISHIKIDNKKKLSKIAKFMGTYSYGIYVYHMIAMNITKSFIKVPYQNAGIGSLTAYVFIKLFLVLNITIIFTFLTNKLIPKVIKD